MNDTKSSQQGFLSFPVVVTIVLGLSILIGGGALLYFKKKEITQILYRSSQDALSVKIFPPHQEVLAPGQAYDVRWEVSSSVVEIEVRLITGGSSGSVLFSKMVNGENGSYLWTVPSDVFDGRYRFMAKAYGKEAVDARQKLLELNDIVQRRKSGDVVKSMQESAVLQRKIEAGTTEDISNFIVISRQRLIPLSVSSISKIVRNKSFDEPGGLYPFGIRYEFDQLPAGVKVDTELFITYTDDVASSVNGTCKMQRDNTQGNYFCYIPWSSSMYQYDRRSNYSIFVKQ